MSNRPSFTLGIEEEYQTIDPVTRDLRSHIQAQIIAQGKMRLQERVKPEMHGSVVEVGTGICHTIAEARGEVFELRRQMVRLAQDNNLRLAAAGTHPFADWKTQEIFPDDRYRTIVEDMQQVARANLIFGLHVHVGIDDRETTIHLMNAARYFLPHILALSVNSPFWKGFNTGLKSYRCKVFDKFPRTNIPDYFQSYGEYENFVAGVVRKANAARGPRVAEDMEAMRFHHANPKNHGAGGRQHHCNNSSAESQMVRFEAFHFDSGNNKQNAQERPCERKYHHAPGEDSFHKVATGNTRVG